MSRDPLDGEKTILPDDKTGGYALAVGQTLGQYRIVRPLGRGGMGEVYEVEHETLERRYALKLLPTDFAGQPGALERFRREAKVMARLEHPNILKVDDFGETGGRYWLRMELAGGVDEGRGARGEGGGQRGEVRGTGVSLQDLAEAKGGRIPQEELVGILKQILEGLAYAHGHGAIHRDLKPSNILFSGGVVKISDFGLVRLVGEEWVRSQAQLSVQRSMSMGDMRTLQKEGEGTSTRSMLGTYEYMSPEQKRGEEATERSDLYAVGLMGYRLLTGRGLSMKTPSQIDKSLAKEWDAFLAEALEEDAGERWTSAKAMQEGLDGLAQSLRIRQAEQIAAANRAEEERRAKAEAERQARIQEEARQAALALRRREEERARQEAEAAAKAKEAVQQIEAGKQRDSWGWGWILVVLAVAGGGIWAASHSKQPEKRPPVSAVAPPLQPRVATPQPLPPPAGDVKTVDLGGGVTLDLAWIPAGTFTMGSPAVEVDRGGDEGPQHEVRFAQGFWMGQTEVTQAQYEQVTGGNPSNWKGANLPVENVSWNDAKEFCRKASQTTGQEVRLPSEAEWEYACRAGTTTPFHYGDSLDATMANFDGNYPYGNGRKGEYRQRTTAVKTFRPNAWGLYDMHGNVWEWCEDWYHDSYNGAPRDGSPWLSPAGSFRALRGGSWGDDAGLCRSARRFWDAPAIANYYCGFRVVLSR